jgi:hypothetical protein
MSLYAVKSDASAAAPRFNGNDAVDGAGEQHRRSEGSGEGSCRTATRMHFGPGPLSKTLWPTSPVLTGWTFRVQVNTTIPVDVSVVGDCDDLLDDIGTKLATALLVSCGCRDCGTAHSAYNTGTNVLTDLRPSRTTSATRLITVTITPPSGYFPSAYVRGHRAISSPSKSGRRNRGCGADSSNFSTTWVIPASIHAYKQ